MIDRPAVGRKVQQIKTYWVVRRGDHPARYYAGADEELASSLELAHHFQNEADASAIANQLGMRVAAACLIYFT